MAVQGTGVKRLAALRELDDYRVAPGNPDIRGWEIYGDGDVHLGETRELIVDTQARKVRYLVAAVGRTFLGLGRRHEVLVPIGRARLDDKRDRVYLDGVSSVAGLMGFPEYDAATFDEAREAALFGGDEGRYARADYDSGRFFGKRAAGEHYVVVREEIVTVQAPPGGEGEVRSVDTAGDRVIVDVPPKKEPV